MRTKRGLAAISLLLGGALFVSACNDTGLEFEPAGSSIIEISFDDLPPLEGGLNYQAWVIRFSNGSYWGAPLAIFNMDDGGNLVDPVSGGPITSEFQANLYPSEVYGVQISIELSQALVSEPASTFLMGGPVQGRSGTLTLAHWLGIGLDFEPMQGSYVLMTPSDGDPGNERSGLWFADNAGGGMAPGLSLPDAPVGWDYEGWVVSGTDTLSTGKFKISTQSDTTDLFGGPTGAPAVPGQDFLYDPPNGMTFPLDLAGGSVFITLEPWEEWDVAPESPFPFRLMAAEIPQDATPETTYLLESLFEQFPRGFVTVKDDEGGSG